MIIRDFFVNFRYADLHNNTLLVESDDVMFYEALHKLVK